MNRIEDAFYNKKALIAYLMAGDPDLDTSANYIITAQEAGVDLIEIGIPFSDPVAEGEVIQASCIRALKAGTRLEGIFDMVASIKEKMYVPMVFMTYLNPVFVYGYDRFFSRCRQIGVSGVIIPDMPAEEQYEAKENAKRYNIKIISLIAPTSKKRMKDIAENAEGFIYLVSSPGVTGIRRNIAADIPSIINEIRRFTDIPIAVGFGISTPEQAKYYLNKADGIIVGSAIVRIIGQQNKDAKRVLYKYISSMSKICHPL